ncbi:diacylglycerol/lipid kinase family protein [Streptomyces alanosinicus]|uniref:Diacylglycerol kinase n=1 Tax=Streptomyces alanosinicus TaxID=68171 RepID=A0A918YUV8_9ACTN|nr:diacylglycerol kinase family protein [Streptomyces alanosinicus]GHE16150.1 diacylglycerol kinase [Streptomyces alanosinicus]
MQGIRRQHVVVIANPRAGSTTAEYLDAVRGVCEDHADDVTIVRTGYPGHATELAKDWVCGPTPPDLLVSIGGDGTLREVVAGTADARASRTPLAVLPGGTANSNYRSLWDDVPWQKALVASLTGEAETRQLDLARVSPLSRLVVLGLSTGLFAEATARATVIPVAGRPRYQRAIAEALETYQPYEGRVLVDGVVVHSGKTVVANVGGSRYRAGVLEMLPHSVRDDGLLDVCVLDPSTPPQEALRLMRTGRHVQAAGTTYAQGRSITLERLDGMPLHFEHDGEVVPSDLTSITVDVLPHAMSVLASHDRTRG